MKIMKKYRIKQDCYYALFYTYKINLCKKNFDFDKVVGGVWL